MKPNPERLVEFWVNVRVYLFVSTLVTIMYIAVSSSTKSMTLTSTDAVPKNPSKWNRTPKGSSNFSNVRVYLFASTLVAVMYIVLSYSTKSMILASTDTSSLKNFQNGTERRKARRILGKCESLSFRLYACSHHIHSRVVLNQKYDPRIHRHRFPQKFSKWNRTPKGSLNFGSTRVYLFVSTLVNPKSFQTL